jgi:N-acetylglucosamine kinase-like BadF-type ATPase
MAMDEQKPTTLLDDVMEIWSLSSIEEVIAYANRIPAPDFSKLTELVVCCAHRGDDVAQEVLQREGRELAQLAALVVSRLQEASQQSRWIPPVAFAGSILEKVQAVRDVVIEELEARFAGVRVLPGVVDPMDGALWRARNRNSAGS